MVGRPSEADRAADRRRVRRWLVGLVAVSAALTAVYGGATALEVGLVGVAGAVVGAALVVALGWWQ